MNELQIFENDEFGQIRTLLINDEPWIVGKDAAMALGYENTRDAIKKHVDEEDKQIIQRSQNATLEIPNRGMTIINESGLYSLIFGSKLEGAKRFKRWVTSEVLPALRRTGHYEIQGFKQAKQRSLTKDDYIRAASIISGCRNERLPYVMAFLEEAGLEIPEVEQIKKQAERMVQSGLDTEENLLKYAGQLAGMGIVKNGWIIVTNKDFTDFCILHGISSNKFRRWLFLNGFIASRVENVKGRGKKTVYTFVERINGSSERVVRFYKDQLL